FAHIPNEQRRRYLAQISLLDDAIGVITGALAESGQTQRTLVFFFSDNGGPVYSGADNGTLRGGKGQLFEGGVRVPFLVSWPDKLPAGKTYDQPVISLDAFASALAASGVPMPADKPYDGVNILPYLAGDVKSSPHERLFWRLRAKEFAVREGAWKLIEPDGAPAQLFDLANDSGENKDLAAEKPDLAQRLAASLAEWRKELKPPAFPGSSVKNEDWGPGGINQKERQPKESNP
ncbi:MAG: sulfatase-like hydrolase/transferase, partial [Opitutaceae bacterium]